MSQLLDIFSLLYYPLPRSLTLGDSTSTLVKVLALIDGWYIEYCLLFLCVLLPCLSSLSLCYLLHAYLLFHVSLALSCFHAPRRPAATIVTSSREGLRAILQGTCWPRELRRVHFHSQEGLEESCLDSWCVGVREKPKESEESDSSQVCGMPSPVNIKQSRIPLLVVSRMCLFSFHCLHRLLNTHHHRCLPPGLQRLVSHLALSWLASLPRRLLPICPVRPAYNTALSKPLFHPLQTSPSSRLAVGEIG